MTARREDRPRAPDAIRQRAQGRALPSVEVDGAVVYDAVHVVDELREGDFPVAVAVGPRELLLHEALILVPIPVGVPELLEQQNHLLRREDAAAIHVDALKSLPERRLVASEILEAQRLLHLRLA